MRRQSKTSVVINRRIGVSYGDTGAGVTWVATGAAGTPALRGGGGDTGLRQRVIDSVANTTTTYSYDMVNRLIGAHGVTTGTATRRDRTRERSRTYNRRNQTVAIVGLTGIPPGMGYPDGGQSERRRRAGARMSMTASAWAAR